MKTINTIKGILLAAILFGVFANFAQNNYGMLIVRIALAFLALLFLIASVYAFKRKKITKSKQSEVSIFEGVGAMLFAISIFFKISHYPFSGVLLILSSLLIIIHLFISSIKYIRNKDDNLSVRLVSVYSNFIIIVGILFVLFNVMHWDGKIIFFILFLILITILSAIFLFSVFNKQKNNIYIKKLTNPLNGNMGTLLLVFTIISIYTISAKVDLAPEFFFNNTPKSLENIRYKASISKSYEERDFLMTKYEFYWNSYSEFIQNRENTENN